MSQERVMLLIDADNLSLDVMEQAVRLLLNQHGGLHVRRAYCTAESAVANQAAFKRLGIKPMVNLATGKNSTDIAMAVDAIDLVLAERPDVVVIASSDSDFAPLVQRLREKGCVVRGVGQKGKVGDETQDVYDDYTVIEHRGGATAKASPQMAVKTTKAPRTSRARVSAAKAVTAPAPAPALASAPAPAPARKRSSGRVAAKKAARPDQGLPPLVADTQAIFEAIVEGTLDAEGPQAEPVAELELLPEAKTSSRKRKSDDAESATLQSVMACLPELAQGQSLALNVAVQRLREARLLGKNSSSLKLFSQLSENFELLPARNPSQVRLRG